MEPHHESRYGGTLEMVIGGVPLFPSYRICRLGVISHHYTSSRVLSQGLRTSNLVKLTLGVRKMILKVFFKHLKGIICVASHKFLPRSKGEVFSSS